MTNTNKSNQIFQRIFTCIKCIFLNLILFTLLSKFSLAQEVGYNLSISPPTFEIYANPGDQLENTIRAENLTDNPLNVVIETRNFVAVGEEGAVDLTEEQNTFSLNNWINVVPQNITIPPHNSQIFKFKTNVPDKAEPGGHFGSIVFKSGGNPSDLKQTGAAISQEIASLILIKVSGPTDEKAHLESFKTLKKFWEHGPVTFETRVKNEGNLHIKPIGTIKIKNIFGKNVASLTVDPKNVLPEAIRRNTTDWNRKWLFGVYTATVNLTYGNPAQTLVSTTKFYGLPYKIVIVVIVFSSLVTYLLYRARRRIKKALKVLFSKN